ncbi:MAG: type II and III secretion system protein family protein [Holosporales bacterium]|jgi:pilus assembly protein CpaC
MTHKFFAKRLIGALVKRFGVLLLAVSLTLAPWASIKAEILATTTTAEETTDLVTGRGVLISLPAAADSVFVSDPAVADVEIRFAELLYLYGIKPGNTNIHVMDKNKRVIYSRTVTVTRNLDTLREALKRLLPDAAIEVLPSNNKVILRGVVKSAAIADQALKIADSYLQESGQGSAAPASGGGQGGRAETSIINMLTIAGSSQITLKVKIAEIRREVGQVFGIDYQASKGSRKDNLIGAIFSKEAPFTQSGGFNPGGFNPLDITGTAYRAALSFADGSMNLDVFLKALETEGYVTILAEPTLTAISGETASFLAGGEFPIAVPQSDGRTTIEFKEYGISLNFAPVVLSPDRIRLRVNPTVSQLTSEGAITLPGAPEGQSAIPALLTRKADTTVELGNGQSFTIAGLFNQQVRDTISKYPWLGDVPILGALFRSNDFRQNNSELVIIVTPYVVEPTSTAEQTTPLDNLREPSDSDRIGFGQTPLTALRPTTLFGQNGGSLAGPVGFIVE